MEEIMHLVTSSHGGYECFQNPNGHCVKAIVNESDRSAASVIEAIGAFAKDNNKGFAFGQLCDALQASMPVCDDVKYVMSLEYAFYVEKTCRLMDDIYVVLDDRSGSTIRRVLVNYVSGVYAS